MTGVTVGRFYCCCGVRAAGSTCGASSLEGARQIGSTYPARFEVRSAFSGDWIERNLWQTGSIFVLEAQC